ncbi:uncharacterized protein TRAVEDRAFT_23587 [Trametes versicolor FP-101664 SS1]|uniref:uncharacterized protein n=1 Tax=Trametes versicolor (strain FP-101664) TaxID=717944 RepID=UPI0004624266|nr:uncharacterized protein TRAVEDRAFT_23587 [Trametes versicolor FP-101664 SS1]EIW54575.1 hypothetical protein TRAVEDRAFT_23587 [Trametes versicolor FP-101664 SS1]
MFSMLPDEILVLIVKAVDRDLKDLENLALACRALLPAIREELFTTVNVCALRETYMRPYFGRIEELRIEEPNPSSNDVMKGRLVPYLDLHALPKLKSIHFSNLCVGFFIWMSTDVYCGLSALTSVTTLALSGCVCFVHLRHIQTLICSLPNLSELSLQDAEYFPSSWTRNLKLPEGFKQLADGVSSEMAVRPKLSNLSVATSITAVTDDVAGWLASGPSKESLTTLVVTRWSNSPSSVLRHFGTNIEHLSIPLKGKGNRACYSRYLGTYTNLRTLTLWLDTMVDSPQAWKVLLHLLEHWISAEHLHTATINVHISSSVLARCESEPLSSHIDWDVLGLLSNTLNNPKFAVLDTVIFEVQWSGEWEVAKVEMRDGALANRIEETLRNVTPAGRRLVTSVRGMRRTYGHGMCWHRGERPSDMKG